MTMYKYNKRSVPLLIVVVCISLVLMISTLVSGTEGPYLSGTWKQIVPLRDQTAYMLCMYQGNVTAPEVSGTVFCSTPAPTEVPTLLGTIAISDKLTGVWKRSAVGEYISKAVAYVSDAQGSVIGTLEITGTLTREGENKINGVWDIKIVNLQGTEMMSIDSESVLNRIVIG